MENEMKERLLWHGILGNPQWNQPRMIYECDVEARPGYSTVIANEYEDEPNVLYEKIELLIYLLQQSSNCLLYTGAGISTSSGINDYATKSTTSKLNNGKKLTSHLAAQPTLAHRVLVSLYNLGLIKKWIQQNHDGLPQKAGLPQHAINEIHGAWYDPTNPVVPMSGRLRDDLINDLIEWEEKTDLTIAIGTSMCGMNADRVFTTVSNKACQYRRKEMKKIGRLITDPWNPHPRCKQLSSTKPVPLGGVIIGIQKTQHDSIASLRIFANIDHVMSIINNTLELPPINMQIGYIPNIPIEYIRDTDVYYIPYNSHGYLLDSPNENKELWTILNLQVGSQIVLTSGPYQGDYGTITKKTRGGHFKIECIHTLDYRKDKIVEPYCMEHNFGSWWIEAAVYGRIPQIPLRNVIKKK
mmetsp:Transcript_21615/g.22374  ORF Transcript_21615/g.22374 Transcript_21615/m.22374 type:complete len:412 (+) Transcript_21615:46-1281(+)